jgi:hypothetical protein
MPEWQLQQASSPRCATLLESCYDRGMNSFTGDGALDWGPRFISLFHLACSKESCCCLQVEVCRVQEPDKAKARPKRR